MAESLTVASFNIRTGHAPDGRDHWLLRRRVTAAWARELDADVLGLQEALGFQRERLAAALPDHAVAGRGRDAGGGGEQVPVFVRPPWLIEDVDHRWFGATPEEPGSKLPGTTLPRLTTSVLCRHRSSGLRMRVLDTHLDHRREENRVASARQLVNDVDRSSAAVLLGDFNARPGDSEVFEVLADAGWRRLRYEGSSFNGWRHGTAHPSGQIDHILVRDGVDTVWHGDTARLVSTETGRLPSDHWPLVADLRLERVG